MLSALYLIGSKVNTLDAFKYIEPCLAEKGIQVLDRAIVPITGLDFFQSSALTALVGDGIGDDIVQRGILYAFQQALSKEGPDESSIFYNQGFIEFICDESTEFQEKILPPRIQCLGIYSRADAASELFSSKCLSYETDFISPRAENLRKVINQLSGAIPVLEERVKILANTRLSEVRRE